MVEIMFVIFFFNGPELKMYVFPIEHGKSSTNRYVGLPEDHQLFLVDPKKTGDALHLRCTQFHCTTQSDPSPGAVWGEFFGTPKCHGILRVYSPFRRG